MFAKVTLLTLVSFALIAFEYKKRQNFKKSLLVLALLIYILLMGYIGFFSLKAYIPLKFIHFIALIFDYFAWLYYLYRGKLYYQPFLIPLITIAIYFGLDFFVGSRFEE